MPRLPLRLLPLLGLLWGASPHADVVTDPDNGEALPPSGIGATTVGQRVLLYGDHTWKVDEYFREDQVTAITDHGRTVNLTRKLDPKTREETLQWSYSDPSGGPIQVVISRAITTDRSEHSNRDNCVPVVTARNLSKLTMFRVVAELEFRAKNGTTSATSLMIGPLDDGEEEEKVASPLFVDDCNDLTATLHIPYCVFANGLDCSNVVTASRYGTIPLELVAEPGKTTEGP